MNVFGNYNYNQYMPQPQHQSNYMAHLYQLSEYYNQNYFYPNPNLRYEVEQIYHYDPTAYVATNSADRYYVYDPIFKKKCGEDAALEEILKKNPDVWNKYRTGRFTVRLENVNGVKKIILKERTDGDADYRIKKYKVRVNKCKDEVMLLSYSQEPNPQQFEPQLPIVHNPTILEQTASMHQAQMQPQIQAPIQSVTTQIGPDLMMNPNEAYINGPGAELVSRIVDGNDSFSPSATTNLGNMQMGNVQVLNQQPILQPILQPAQLPTLLPLQSLQSAPQIIQTVLSAQPGVSLTQFGQAVQEPNYYQSYNEKLQDYQASQSNQANITPIGLHPQSVTPKEMFEDETLNDYNTIKSNTDKSVKKLNTQVPGKKSKNTDRLFGSVKEALQTLNSNEDYSNSNNTPKSMNSGRVASNNSNYSNVKTSTSKRFATNQSTQNKISNALNDQSGEIEWEQSTSVEELDLLPKDTKSRIHGIDNVNIERRSVRDTFLKSGERSSIAYTASQVEANQETLSIGPISMAGGSLYGGDYTYDTAMQSQVNNDAKSAFSEYSIGKENNETSNLNDQYNNSNLKRII